MEKKRRPEKKRFLERRESDRHNEKKGTAALLEGKKKSKIFFLPEKEGSAGERRGRWRFAVKSLGRRGEHGSSGC